MIVNDHDVFAIVRYLNGDIHAVRVDSYSEQEFMKTPRVIQFCRSYNRQERLQHWRNFYG